MSSRIRAREIEEIVKISIIIAGILLGSSSVWAQVSNPSIVKVNSTPTSCSTLPMKVINNTASLYGSDGAGGCTLIGGGGGNLSGTLTSGFYPLASGTHTLVNGVIDQDVTFAGYFTIATALDKNIEVYTTGNSTAASFQACNADATTCDGLIVSSPATTNTEVDLTSHGSVLIGSGASKTVSLTANNLSSMQVTEHGLETNGAAPTSDVGSLGTGSSNNMGVVTGLSAATSVTITFNGGGFTNQAFCTASASVALATAPAVNTISKTSVKFTFPALTGSLYYVCLGN